MDKYLSVITNFDCHYTCPYCIVKNNNLQIPKSTLEGIDSLADEIKRNNCNWVSLSGGGDPIWDYENHKDWYNKFFDIVYDNKPIKTNINRSKHNYLKSYDGTLPLSNRNIFKDKDVVKKIVYDAVAKFEAEEAGIC
jgi:organic radical activating enzyme